MNELILATSNQGKINELSVLLSGIHCIPQEMLDIQDVEETGLSLIENAIIKARHASFIANKPALADDSGLVVPALNGEPGIYSARYAGNNRNAKDNIALLLEKMSLMRERQAYFYCAIALVRHAQDPTPFVATGSLQGMIAREPQGDYGFGYDPIFYVAEYQCTAAQLSPQIKNQISHRAMALKQLQTLNIDSLWMI